MTSPSSVTPLRRTPLYQLHVEHGAKMVEFGGWEMPLQYKGIVAEHRAVRSAVGLFDVSHMGEVAVRRAGAAAAIQRLITNDASKLVDGGALYTVMCTPNGGIVDDCIVYRRAADDYMIIVNASNAAKDLAWIRHHAGGAAEVVDESDQTGLIAVQGPAAVALCARLANRADLASVKRFHFARCELAGVPCLAARTGYTGEDGFELACPAGRAAELWTALLAEGAADGVQPIGLGARDTLRLEARLSLYGNDIDETTTPLEAGLGWVVKLDAGEFIGHDALARQKADGVKRSLVGFRIDGRGIARHGYSIVDRSRPAGADDDQVIGLVTSGTTGITVGGAIGLGYVPVDRAAPGSQLTIDCRGKDVAAQVVKGPFYQRGREVS
ncbi:MAG TPA: glycine cleavage system aminomethyltransferase GcvT [Kofleriaceae bacterium]|nr:glycine cleavage system aminomethyltransferase GcvT [Kofleriaceae bacterium]